MWDRLFTVGIIFTGLGGALELTGGTLLLFVAPEKIKHQAILFTQPDLTEDLDDFIANHMLRGAAGLTGHVVFFGALHLWAHGIVKVVLAVALLREKLWAYPWMITVVVIFIIYQLAMPRRPGCRP